MAPTHPAAYLNGMWPTEDDEMRRFAAGEVVWVLTEEATRDAGSVHI